MTATFPTSPSATRSAPRSRDLPDRPRRPRRAPRTHDPLRTVDLTFPERTWVRVETRRPTPRSG